MNQKAALLYRDKGFSVIPVKGNKKPYIPWTEFQERKATVEEIEQWWKKWPGANVGIVTGKISGVVVKADPETGEALSVERFKEDFDLKTFQKADSDDNED